jgi:hypothetical protein
MILERTGGFQVVGEFIRANLSVRGGSTRVGLTPDKDHP